MPPSRMPRTGNEGKQLKRLLGDLWKGYKKELIFVTICLLLTSISNTVGSLFTPRIINEVIAPVIDPKLNVSFSDVQGLLLELVLTMAVRL